MTKKIRAPSKPLRQPVEICWAPESEAWLKERLKSPEGKQALRDLARIIAEQVVDDLIKEAESQTAGAKIEDSGP
jgi:hypothetical protein